LSHRWVVNRFVCPKANPLRWQSCRARIVLASERRYHPLGIPENYKEAVSGTALSAGGLRVSQAGPPVARRSTHGRMSAMEFVPGLSLPEIGPEDTSKLTAGFPKG